MRHCDVFVFLDDVQMPGGQSYVYRTRVRGPVDMQWLSLDTHRQLGDAIQDVRLAHTNWPVAHARTLQTVYGRCPHFGETWALLEPIYNTPGNTLADFNIRLIRVIAAYLGLPCRLEKSSELRPEGHGDDRLISLAQITGADVYVSGPGGRKYQDPAKFAAHGVALEINEYAPIPYAQSHGAFVPALSIVDALCHLGRHAVRLLEYPAPAPSTDPTFSPALEDRAINPLK